MSIKKIAIIGGGRWARVISNVLSELVSSDTIIDMHSLHNANGLKEWLRNNKNRDRIQIFDKWPSFENKNRPEAIIIANAARMHFPAAVYSLFNGVPVLIEKPITITSMEASFLVSLSRELEVPLYSAHVFAFARYIRNFSDLLKKCKSLQNINITWTDPVTELRHGEKKSYDASITVIHDVMPHIISIIRSFSDARIKYNNMVFERGGAKIQLELNVGDIVSTVNLERNAASRIRTILVETADGPLKLDFSLEPGQIDAFNQSINSVPEWDSLPRPLSTMLKDFLEMVEIGTLDDERFSPELGIEACEITEAALKDYLAKQMSWLNSRYGKDTDDNLLYTLAELTYH